MHITLSTLIDDARCYRIIRQTRWQDGICCPRCESQEVIKRGKDDTQPHRQRYQCKSCGFHFDDLTDTIFAGHHQPLQKWIGCLYLIGLNLSSEQIAQELDLDKDDVYLMKRRRTLVPSRHELAAGSIV
jgi:transposase-like protein